MELITLFLNRYVISTYILGKPYKKWEIDPIDAVNLKLGYNNCNNSEDYYHRHHMFSML